MTSDEASAYFSTISQRLQGEGYQPGEAAHMAGTKIPLWLGRSRFELSKMGISDEIFTFSHFSSPTPENLKVFSADAYAFALTQKKSMLPRGIFASVWSYSCAVCDNLSPESAQFIQTTAPAKHWAAAEIPAAFDLSTGKIVYFEGTPMWGAAYYSGFRKTIQRLLQP